MKAPFGWLIGDPHLGRKFEVGVPIHRRGEREREQIALFIEELQQPGEIVVMVGDLFDHPYVPHAVVKQAIDAVLDAATQRPGTEFIMMAGNHDMPRKITGTGAFDVFLRACAMRLPNLHVLTVPDVINDVAFFPWQWDVAAEKQVEDIASYGYTGIRAAVGHWDLASFGGEDLHLAPVAALRHAFGDVPLYSGHYHAPRTYTVGGVDIIGVGSMQPYGQAEDPEGLIYATLDLSELQEADPASLRDMCLRVRLRPGEQLPDSFDARSIVGQRVANDFAPDAGQTLALDKFDWGGIVRSKLAPLDPGVKAFIEERLPSYGSS